MTDEEIKAAGRAYLKWVPPSKHRREDLAFDAGYGAGLQAERARSAKLRGYLKALALLQPPQVMATEFWVEVSHVLEEGNP